MIPALLLKLVIELIFISGPIIQDESIGGAGFICFLLSQVVCQRNPSLNVLITKNYLVHVHASCFVNQVDKKKDKQKVPCREKANGC